MKENLLSKTSQLFLVSLFFAAAPLFAQGQNSLTMNERVQVLGMTPPIPISLSGFTGEGAEVLKFDLYVQGFTFVSPEEAQFQITGSDAGGITGNVTDKVARKMILSRSYNGAS